MDTEAIKKYEKIKKSRLAIGIKLESQLNEVYVLNIPDETREELTNHINKKIEINDNLLDYLGHAINVLLQYEEEGFLKGMQRRIDRLTAQFNEVDNNELGIYLKSLLQKGKNV